MSRELLTPVNRSQTTVDLANRRFRKQIIPFIEIDYKGRKIKFDRQYLTELSNAFRAKAFDQNPFQLADAGNRHTNDPERFRGEMIDVELTEDGLDGIFELSDDGAATIDKNPKLGVSARIIENYDRADGKRFPCAIQHVLGTLDPRIPDMKPWQEVQLSNEHVTETIDLSGEVVGEEKKMTKPKMVTVELSEDDHATLVQLLSDQRVAVALANGEDLPEGTDPEDDEDEEVEGAPASVPAPTTPDDEPEEDAEEEEEEPVSLSRGHLAAIELANATANTAQSQVLELTNQLRTAEVQRELDRYLNAGLAPAIVEAARPVLELPAQTIELSNGQSVDPGQAVRDMLTTVLELARTGQDVIDLDVETGVLRATDSVVEQRASLVAAARDQFGN